MKICTNLHNRRYYWVVARNINYARTEINYYNSIKQNMMLKCKFATYAINALKKDLALVQLRQS